MDNTKEVKVKKDIKSLYILNIIFAFINLAVIAIFGTLILHYESILLAMYYRIKAGL